MLAGSLVGDRGEIRLCRLEFIDWEEKVKLNLAHKPAVSLLLLVLAGFVFGAASPEDLTLHLDTSDTGHPISPYIYGQFIEHLGRCIYGGLWAEMLEDRKFFYPVDGSTPAWTLHQPGESSWEGEGHPYEILTRSPWLIIGNADSVEMVRQGSFVGEHTPRVHLRENERTGIYQADLALDERRDYVGRVVLAGDTAGSPLRVGLIWGRGASSRVHLDIGDLGRDYVTIPFRFRSGGTTENGRLEIVGQGEGSFRVGAVSLMPADHILGWRADTVRLLRQLDSPVYRWPGGNFVSGYDWRDGIGDRDRRPPRRNPAWTGIEPNDVGIHEFIDLCREIGSEPFIALNTGLGNVESAAQQVEYANGGPETEMGQLRAQNGHPVPFDVRWWAVGNEMYGDWQLGHMPLDEYVKKHNRVAETIWAVHPEVKLIGVGAVGEWSRTMLGSSANHMNLISEHLYWQDRDDLVAHVKQIPERIRLVAEAHRTYRRELVTLQGKEIPIAMDEWNYWYGPFEYGELGVRYFLQDALGIAAGLHEFFRNSDIFLMANYAQTVNVIGAIKTTKTDAEFETTGLVLKLYRERFGTLPVKVSGNHEPLDVAAAWTEDRRGLTVGVVNPSNEEKRLELSVSGEALTARGRVWTISGSDRWLHNEPGKPRRVDAVHSSIEIGDNVLRVPALSVSLFWLEGPQTGWRE